MPGPTSVSNPVTTVTPLPLIRVRSTPAQLASGWRASNASRVLPPGLGATAIDLAAAAFTGQRAKPLFAERRAYRIDPRPVATLGA